MDGMYEDEDAARTTTGGEMKTTTGSRDEDKSATATGMDVDANANDEDAARTTTGGEMKNATGGGDGEEKDEHEDMVAVAVGWYQNGPIDASNTRIIIQSK